MTASCAATDDGSIFPKLVTDPDLCLPDAPGEFGCPLLERGALLPDEDRVVCADVCNEYAGSVTNGIEVGYTRDATLINQQQEARGIEPQCQQNGFLCGG